MVEPWNRYEMESQQPRDTVVAFFSVAINFVAPCSIVSETTVWSDRLRDRVASLVDSGRIFTRYSYDRHESVHIFFAAKHGGSSSRIPDLYILASSAPTYASNREPRWIVDAG